VVAVRVIWWLRPDPAVFTLFERAACLKLLACSWMILAPPLLPQPPHTHMCTYERTPTPPPTHTQSHTHTQSYTCANLPPRSPPPGLS
jgi:hypothetical protein